MIVKNTVELHDHVQYARGADAATRYALALDTENENAQDLHHYARALECASLQLSIAADLDIPSPYGSLRERYERMGQGRNVPEPERRAWRDALAILTAPAGAPCIIGNADIHGQGWHYGEYMIDTCECDECRSGDEDANVEAQRLAEAAASYYAAYAASGDEDALKYARELHQQATQAQYEPPEDHLSVSCDLCEQPIGTWGYTCLDGGNDYCSSCVVILEAPALLVAIVEHAANG